VLQGKTFEGLFHVTDILPTLLEGAMGLDLADTGLDTSVIDGVNQ
jgi:hypothetical protein